MNKIALKPDPANPNRMDAADKARMAKSLADFGDLSGVVLNRRTGLLVGGHQRAGVLAGAVIEATDLPKAEPDGTVARGWLLSGGRRYSLRVVDWPEAKAHAALLAANRFGRVGADDPAVLKDLLQELDTGATDMDLTGYSEEERERLATQFHRDLAERIAEEPVYTETDTKADRRAAKIAERLTALAKNHKPQLERAAVIVLSAESPEFLCIEDAALPDFLAELRRYADQGTESPLVAILDHVHKL
jgi:hypothetical protein